MPSGYPNIVRFTERALRLCGASGIMKTCGQVQNRRVSGGRPTKNVGHTCCDGANRGLESFILMNLLNVNQRLAFYTVVSKYR